MKFVLVLALLVAVVSAQQQQQVVAPTQGPTPPQQQQTQQQAQQSAAPFSYENGGSDWVGLCKTGVAQSPINIETAKTKCVRHGEADAKQHRIDFHYVPAANLSMVHNGNTLKVKGDLGFVTIGGCNPCDGQEYTVKQFHFHTPSEHTIDATPEKAGRYEMELHIVHQKKGSTGLNDLVFVTILFYIQPDGGFPNYFLENINWNWAPKTPNASNKIQSAVDMMRLKESLHGEFYTYKGSLSTPPCTESVQYYVMKNPLGVTKEQAEIIKSIFVKNGKGNNRPVQATNNREVVWYRRRH
jgi:carbonic anhydrase